MGAAMGDGSEVKVSGKFPAAFFLALLMGPPAPGAADPRVGVMTHFAQGWDTSWADVAEGLSLIHI